MTESITCVHYYIMSFYIIIVFKLRNICSTTDGTYAELYVLARCVCVLVMFIIFIYLLLVVLKKQSL